MKTANDVYLNIRESEYFVQVSNFRFYFSSKFYMNNFLEKANEFVNQETGKLYSKFGININLDLYFLIGYYKKLEKRGFYIVDIIENKEITKNVSLTNTILTY